MQRGNYPYKNLGEKLKKWREKLAESLLEVSEAVEIHAEDLTSIEAGAVLPSEEVLLLLISHLGISEAEAKKLFKQAGYGFEQPEPAVDEQLIKQALMIIPVDNRILYSDAVSVSANDNGLVMNFKQNAGNPKHVSVARIGMSLEHARRLQQLLTKIINESSVSKSPRLLAAPKTKKAETEKRPKS